MNSPANKNLNIGLIRKKCKVTGIYLLKELPIRAEYISIYQLEEQNVLINE